MNTHDEDPSTNRQRPDKLRAELSPTALRAARPAEQPYPIKHLETLPAGRPPAQLEFGPGFVWIQDEGREQAFCLDEHDLRALEHIVAILKAWKASEAAAA